MHWPPRQAPAHATPQAPQFIASLSRVTHCEPHPGASHEVVPPLHNQVHWPPTHSSVAEHERPQLPQLERLVDRVTQAPLQLVCDEGHVVVHVR
jgi:hypothetical protein